MDGRDGFVHKGFWEVYVGDKFIRVLSSIRSLDDFGFRYYLPLKNGLYVGNMGYTHNEMTTRVIILDDIQKHKIELIYNVSPELKLLIDVDWPSIPTLQSNIYLKRTQTDVTGGSSIIIDGENKGSLELNFNGDKRITSFKLDLPTYNGFEKLSGSLIKKSEKSLEMLSGSILRKGERHVEFDIKYDLKNSFVDIDISSTEPQQSSLKLKASAEKDMFKTNWVLNFIDVHKGHIEFKKGKDQYLLNIDVEDYTLKIDFHNQQGVVESEIVVNIPNRDIISCQVRYTDNLPSVVTGNVHFTWNSTMAFEFDLQLKTSSGLEGSAILKTPFPKYKYTELKGFHQGTWAQYRTSAQCTFVGKSISIAADITPIKVRVIIQTPFKYTENVEFEFFQSTGDSEYKAGMNVIYATGKELTLTVGHASKKMSMASFVAFESPFTSPLAIIANHTRTLSSDFTTIYQVKNGADSVTIEVTMKYGLQSIVCSSSLTTVFEGEISEQSFKVTHIGRLDRFKTEASVKVFGQEISLDTSLQLDPVMEAYITLLTPYTNIRNLHAAFTNNYNPNSILSTGIVQWAENRKFTGRIDVVKNVLNHMTANMETSMTLTTPFEELKQTALSVSH
ncbi:hypothetical protein DPMN_057015 [Dreissena polymorpha]|uniref:Uncharacterized protein n=1 Tax=Dreissena polymorpha TaxID=45954 RepID=A0A9D4CSS0_DREPO|nr:hypothetical protein DPMN_057015 [Dreissena polymorpha]